MKRFTCLILALVFSLSLAFSAAAWQTINEDKDFSIKVMSFNVRCIAMEQNPVNNWINRKDNVLEVIEVFKPDIIGFQELKEPQYQFFRDNLNEYGFYGEHRHSFELISEASAIFWKKNRFEALEKETFWLSETPEVMSKGWDASVERICTQIKFRDNLTQEGFIHFNTHLDHQGSVAKTQSVNLILDKIEDKGMPSLVTGDFNFHEGGQNYELLLSENLQDTKYLAPKNNTDFGPTFNGFRGSSHTRPIDFILTSPEFCANKYKVIRNTDEQGNYPSDHFPVIAEVEFTK
ncbi:MAG: endonuclease/exonuclease/phosphatase family protein [Bacillota bacterium]